MPNPISTVDSPTSDNWFQGDIPGGDVSFDDLFSPEQTIANSITPQTTATPQANPQPQVVETPTPTPQEPFLKTSRSVYKNAEEAQKGIEAKDELIENLRQQYILQHGIDPITKRPVPLESQTNQPVNYLQDNKRYMKDLREAVEKGDESAYFQAQAKLVFDLLAPIAPTINELAKQQAAQRVGSEITEFSTFRNSESFKTVLDQNEPLKVAIETAEQDYRGHAQLPGLYKLAYLASKGTQVPELVRQATQAAANQSHPQQQVRQTLAPSTIAPTTRSAPEPTLNTSEGRKAIIQQWKERGGDDFVF